MIKINNLVRVNFNNVKFTLCNKAHVLHIPNAIGDSWIFKDSETGAVHYVSEPCTVSLIGNDDEPQQQFYVE